jgi:hypothetical protein
LNVRPLIEAQEQAELFVTQRILLPGMMIFTGVVAAGAGFVATGVVCATALGCLASPVTLSVAVGGLVLADEGIYYAINGKFFVPGR